MSKTIEDAAERYANEVREGLSFHACEPYEVASFVEEAYLDGANHVLSLPLSERLTEEEKMRVRNEYARTYPDDIDCGIENIMVRAALERIFGKEMFEKEGE